MAAHTFSTNRISKSGEDVRVPRIAEESCQDGDNDMTTANALDSTRFGTVDSDTHAAMRNAPDTKTGLRPH